MFDAGPEYYFEAMLNYTDGSKKLVERYGWGIEAQQTAAGFNKWPGRSWFKSYSYHTVDKTHSMHAPAIGLTFEVCK